MKLAEKQQKLFKQPPRVGRNSGNAAGGIGGPRLLFAALLLGALSTANAAFSEPYLLDAQDKLRIRVIE